MRIKLTLKREQDVSLEEKLSFTVVKSLHKICPSQLGISGTASQYYTRDINHFKIVKKKDDIVGYTTCKTLTRILVFRFDLKVDHEYQLGKMMASMVKSFKIHHIQVILP